MAYTIPKPWDDREETSVSRAAMARPRVGGFNHISRYELIIHDYPIYEMIV